MTETQELLSKISALRQRLDQARGLAQNAGTATAALLKDGRVGGNLRSKVEASIRQQELLDSALKQLSSIAAAGGDGASLPILLTARAARLCRRAHELFSQLKGLGDDSLLSGDGNDPLAFLYRETASMTDAVLRTVQAFPQAPSAQMRMCEGLEAVLGVVADRLTVVTKTLQARAREMARREALADMLSALAANRSVELKGFLTIAESVQEDVIQGAPLQFPECGFDNVARHVAAHSLAVAQVVARLTRHDTAWRGKPLEPIMAALVHDVGMLHVPAALLGQSQPLTEEQRRQIEAHPIVGADMAARITPNSNWLIEAAGQHHERLDGTGYPAGLQALQIQPLVRLLSVCDIYAAMCQPRTHRAAFDTRTALTDTLLLAEQGGLDRNHAERLLQLSFYPAGTVVELSDGAVGLVVATHPVGRDLNTPARPVVALLTDTEGTLLPGPRHLDLALVEGISILRGVPTAERRELLGKRYPELA